MSSIRHSLPAVFIVIAALAHPARAQQTELAAGPAADPADVASVDAIITAVYDAIFGPAGDERNWNRFRSLFIPEARLIAIVRREDGQLVRVVRDVDGFIETANDYFVNNGFFEIESARIEEGYGHIVHAFSTYESRNKAEDPEPFQRGINSFCSVLQETSQSIVHRISRLEHRS